MESRKDFFDTEYPKLNRKEKINFWFGYCYHLNRQDSYGEENESCFNPTIYQQLPLEKEIKLSS
jgi:hypothetical protein